MRFALAVLMMLHGLAHLVGFAGSWQLGKPGGIPYKTTVLAGRVDLGDIGIRLVAILWLMVAIAFAGVAIAAFTNRAGWESAAIAIAATSLALTLVELPAARIGIVVNIVLLAGLILRRRYGSM